MCFSSLKILPPHPRPYMIFLDTFNEVNCWNDLMRILYNQCFVADLLGPSWLMPPQFVALSLSFSLGMSLGLIKVVFHSAEGGHLFWHDPSLNQAPIGTPTLAIHLASPNSLCLNVWTLAASHLALYPSSVVRWWGAGVVRSLLARSSFKKLQVDIKFLLIEKALYRKVISLIHVFGCYSLIIRCRIRLVFL